MDSHARYGKKVIRAAVGSLFMMGLPIALICVVRLTMDPRVTRKSMEPLQSRVGIESAIIRSHLSASSPS